MDNTSFSSCQKAVLISILLGLLTLVMYGQCGCALFGGSTAKPVTKPVAKVNPELETVKKEVIKSHKNYEDIKGNIATFEQRYSIMKTEMKTMNKQITEVNNSNVQHNESLKSIMWTVAGIYILLKALKFAKNMILAYTNKGSTLKNLVGIK